MRSRTTSGSTTSDCTHSGTAEGYGLASGCGCGCGLWAVGCVRAGCRACPFRGPGSWAGRSHRSAGSARPVPLPPEVRLVRQLPVPARLIAAVMTVAASAGCMSVSDHPGGPAPSATNTKGTQRTDTRPDGAAAAPDGGGRDRVHGATDDGSDADGDGASAHGKSARKATGASEKAGTAGKGGDGAEPSADPSAPGARTPRPGHSGPRRPPGHGGRPSGRPKPPGGDPTPPTQPSDPPRTSPTPDPGSSPPGATTAPSAGPAKRSEAMLIPLASPQAEPVRQAGFAREGEG